MDKWIEVKEGMLNLSEFRKVTIPKSEGKGWVIELHFKVGFAKYDPVRIRSKSEDSAEKLYNKIKSTLLNNPIHSSKFLQ